MTKQSPILRALYLLLLLGAACSFPVHRDQIPIPTPRSGSTRVPPPETAAAAGAPAIWTNTSLPSSGPTAVGTTPPAAPSSSFCLDTRPPGVIASLRTALLTSDGSLLASLVDPIHGMDVQLLRNGTMVDYDRQHARYLFESGYSIDWGSGPGSGMPIRGSFREMVVPALLDVLTKDYSLECNELQIGGATYTPAWPFPTIDFYSVHVPGTQANGGLDWHTWAVGMQSVADKMYIRAITQFQWEP